MSGFGPETMKAQGGRSKDGQVGRGELQDHHQKVSGGIRERSCQSKSLWTAVFQFSEQTDNGVEEGL